MGQLRKWSEYEIEYLKNNSDKYSVQFIAKRLNRSVSAVALKRKRLGIVPYSCSNSTYISARSLGKILKKDKTTIANWINKYDDFPIDNNKRVITNAKLIIFEEVLNWLEKHQNLFLATDIEPYSLGFEPEWLKRKRVSDRYKKKRTLKQYTTKECQKILEYRKSGLTYKEIGKLVNRSAISIEHKINRMKGSELF